jgi:cytoskeletal protein CcmA (bactofilin family)
MIDNEAGSLSVGAGVFMQGDIEVPAEAIVDGQIDGSISANSLHITVNGSVNGTSTANHIRLAGVVTDNTVANKTLLIEAIVNATGNIAYADLEIRRGGNIQGSIKIIKTDETSSGKSFDTALISQEDDRE